MTANHIYRYEDGARTRGKQYPLCGQANAHRGIVIGPEQETPAEATCNRCIKRHKAGEL